MPTHDKHFRMLSEAVQAWYRYYEVEPDDQASQTLCSAAIEFFNDGARSLEDVTTLLIGTYVGRWATRVNAPTSAAVH
ncbi:UNVERIFIED_ORG: hypothetical protein GGI57_005797 [Rhizobium aethiopicum]|uniref:hypothetical protein n=1 Tax=unclassified Rhizobium TaxID=2613769 RepID=UPI0007EBB57F|nr:MULTISPECIES: hypothetical protein [unclassified Rhizobium]ANM13548.1 hypothetical protein AMK05_PC00032 [Rhizobium sp. N324]ANM19936.1 hypothetical protein AMK06_PC100024 [Rhizobium sp. N541]ANM26321.1 hypothetical protein AMK07_PC100024 [Rhizobium sp. N941]OYD00581.1 hypothetical protein AMK08_PC00032 [Rhizobium sp. N4311]